MSDKIAAAGGSTSVGGDVNASLTNISISDSKNVNLTLQQRNDNDIELPSCLGDVISIFSRQALSDYAKGDRRPIPPEVTEKLKFNNLPADHYLLSDYSRYSLMLLRAYEGAEQENPDAQVLVRRRAQVAYIDHAEEACKLCAPAVTRREYVTANAPAVIKAVVGQLLDEYRASADGTIRQETAHLAISLVVADAVIECEVLEVPPNATTA